MEFTEYKSANYWQSQRTQSQAKAQQPQEVSKANLVAIAVTAALFPILYCIASVLDG